MALRVAVCGAVLAVAIGCGSSSGGSNSAKDGGAGASGSAGSAGAASGGSAGASGSGGGGGSAGAPAALEKFATLTSPASGMAFGKDVNGNTALFVALPAENKIVKVVASGAVGDVASVPAPAGIALAADGSLLVCGDGPAGDQAMVYQLKPSDGSVTPLVYNATEFAGKHFVAIAVAPDDRIVFSDDGSAIYRADKDGTNVSVASAKVAGPSALAFSADGATLYAASSDNTLWKVARNTSLGTFSTAAKVGAPGIASIRSVSVMKNGDLVLVGAGVERVHADATSPALLATAADLPANGAAAFGVDGFGATTLYVTNGDYVERLALPDGAIALPVR